MKELFEMAKSSVEDFKSDKSRIERTFIEIEEPMLISYGMIKACYQDDIPEWANTFESVLISEYNEYLKQNPIVYFGKPVEKDFIYQYLEENYFEIM